MNSPNINNRYLFEEFFQINDELAILKKLENLKSVEWAPLGGNENNFGVIENQQASPIAATAIKLGKSLSK